MGRILKSFLAKIHARRAVLRAQCATAEQEYNQLERQIRQLDRQLCVMRGALNELDALAAEDTAPEENALPATREE